MVVVGGLRGVDSLQDNLLWLCERLSRRPPSCPPARVHILRPPRLRVTTSSPLHSHPPAAVSHSGQFPHSKPQNLSFPLACGFCRSNDDKLPATARANSWLVPRTYSAGLCPYSQLLSRFFPTSPCCYHRRRHHQCSADA